MAPLTSAMAAGQGGGALLAELLLAVGANPLVHLNAALNALATLLLIAAWRQIRRRREAAHGRTMLAALAVSAAFLVSYLVYHAIAGSVRFTAPGAVRYVYYAVLLSHVVLAFTVPVFAVLAALFGVQALGWGRAARLPEEARQRARQRHRRVVRWGYPIWLYVSITGVVVYAMLYHLWPSTDVYPTLDKTEVDVEAAVHRRERPAAVAARARDLRVRESRWEASPSG